METMTPERIIPFTTTRDDVKNTLTDMLIKTYQTRRKKNAEEYLKG